MNTEDDMDRALRELLDGRGEDTHLNSKQADAVLAALRSFESTWHGLNGWDTCPAILMIGARIDGGREMRGILTTALRLPPAFWEGPVPTVGVNPFEILDGVVERAETDSEWLARFLITHSDEDTRAAMPVGIGFLCEAYSDSYEGVRDEMRAAVAVDLDDRVYEVYRTRYGHDLYYRRKTIAEVRDDALAAAAKAGVSPMDALDADRLPRIPGLVARLMRAIRHMDNKSRRCPPA